MTTYYAYGSTATDLSHGDLRDALSQTLDAIGPRHKVLAVPPDHTRDKSYAGVLACQLHELLGDNLKDVMPALGTHFAMTDDQLAYMFPTLPKSLIRIHDWRNDVITIGEVPSEFVSEVTGGVYTKAWPAQLNKLVWEGGHDAIFSLGQVVPHEVIGMANYNKNLFVGTGGQLGINESHYIGAVYGMERMMGRTDTPLRRILNRAEELFCQHLPVIYVQTVVGAKEDGSTAVRGLYIGDDKDCFEQAAELAKVVNFTRVEEPLKKVVVRLDPKKFHSTWIGNKAIYRTRMAIADGGHLIVLGEGVKTFGEDPEIDRLIEKYGYRTTPEILEAVENNDDLRSNLSAAAHLMHGTSENRFKVTWCPGGLSEERIRSVSYDYADYDEMDAKYPALKMKEGWNTVDGEEVYYISNPALGLWAHESRL
jgi:nickel-dependent lactate racemase